MQAVLSDGEHSIEVVISTHLSHLVQSGQLEEFTIIKVKTYQYNITDDNIHIVSISEVDIFEENPGEVIGDPTSVLDIMHKEDIKAGDHYFTEDDDDWDSGSLTEEPLTWSLDEPSNFCDWTIEVSRIHSPPPPTGVMSKSPGKEKHLHNKHYREYKDKGKEVNRADSKPLIQYYHVHRAILSVG